MKKLFLLVSFLFFLITTSAFGQQVDGAFSLSTLTSTSAANAGVNFQPQSIGGGLFPGFSGDFLFWHNLGIGGEVNWRAKQNVYQGVQPFRPILYDFNAVWAPPLGRKKSKASAELQAGFGGTSTRFYQPFFNCNFFSCTDFNSVNHLAGHVGEGVMAVLQLDPIMPVRENLGHRAFALDEIFLQPRSSNFGAPAEGAPLCFMTRAD